MSAIRRAVRVINSFDVTVRFNSVTNDDLMKSSFIREKSEPNIRIYESF